jgi:uncharacterized protein (UPF0333 family)
MHGQASLEQLFVTALGITFVGIMFFLSVTMSGDTIRSVQASDTVERLAKTADLVYAMGPGSRMSTEVLIPDNIRAVNISSNRILIRISLTGGDSDIFAYSKAQLNGTLTRNPGRHTVYFSVDNSSIVQINSTG